MKNPFSNFYRLKNQTTHTPHGLLRLRRTLDRSSRFSEARRHARAKGKRPRWRTRMRPAPPVVARELGYPGRWDRAPCQHNNHRDGE